MQFIHSKCSFCGKPVVRAKQAASANVRRHFCDLKCKANFQKLAKPVTKKWLHRQYIILKRDTSSIARIVNRDPKSVWNWLKDFGIPTRPRGSYDQWRPKGRKPGFRHGRTTKRKLRAARIADGRVPYLKNGKHWLKSVPRDRHPNWLGGCTPERQAFYSSPEWIAVARKVWNRDKNQCRRCRKRWRRGEPFDIHHIVTFACRELRAELSNLLLLCERCHYWVHSSKNKARRFVKRWP